MFKSEQKSAVKQTLSLWTLSYNIKLSLLYDRHVYAI